VYVVGEPAKAGGDEWENDRGERRLNLEGFRFVEDTLKPGTARVEVRLRGEDRALVVVQDVVVKAGEMNRDPRLQIDVRKLLSVRTITVVDASDGSPIEGASVFTPALEQIVSAATDQKGQTLLATKERAVDVVAWKKGYRSTALPQVTADATAQLRKTAPIRVTIKLADGVVMPGAPFGISVKLEWVCGLDEEKTSPEWSDPRNWAEDVRFGRDRVATFLVDDPGRYKVKLSVTKEIVNGRSWSEIESDDPSARIRVEGPDVSATVTAPAAAVAEAVKNLAK
jgi:hypothetical protein